MSICNVQNIVSEEIKGYINQQDLLSLLKYLFPDVANIQDFHLNTRNRRWTFLAPAKVQDEEIRRLMKPRRRTF